jgi:hypothetical protein
MQTISMPAKVDAEEASQLASGATLDLISMTKLT